MSKLNIGVGVLSAGLVWGCSEAVDSGHQPEGQTQAKSQTMQRSDEPVGLSLFFQNGTAQPIALVGDSARYLQEIDISEQVVTATDEGIDPLLVAPQTADWDWRGAQLVEEEYVPSLDGTFTRERYYRGAKWMERPVRFTLTAHDADGKRIGHKLRFDAGTDDKWRRADDGFVRRLSARQLALGCSAPGDCTGATYVAEVLVQARSAVHPERRARRIARRAVELRLSMSLSGEKHTSRSVAVSHVPKASAPYGYGFSVQLAPVSTPPGGDFYEPGDSVTFRLSFYDGQGQRLHPLGSLASYAEYMAGTVDSGLEYLNLGLQTRLYYALKNREANLMMGISGPVDQLQAAQTVVDPLTFFLPQTQFAFAGVDGYTSVIQTVPAAAIIFGGFQDPSLWSAPVSDEVTFTIPDDAQPGTYLAVVKARRYYGGEALQTGATAYIQVGQTEPTPFLSGTSCGDCHSSPGARLTDTLHGIADRSTCFTCHSSLAIEFDNALDIRVHRVHALSDRFPGDVKDCTTCHLTVPSGPARGL